MRSHALLFSLMLVPRLAAAQLLTGKVEEAGTALPVAAAEIIVWSSTDNELARVLTDSIGRFSVKWSGAERVKLTAQRLGFQPAATELFEVRAGETVTARLLMSVSAVKLDALTIIARERTPAASGEMAALSSVAGKPARAASSREQIVASKAYQVADLLRTTPGISLRATGGNSMELEAWSNSSNLSSNPMARGTSNSAIGRMQPGTPSGPCPMVLFIDGRIHRNSTNGVNAYPAQHIEAIEIFRGPSEVPSEFSGDHARCGVIAIWTRRS